jgi:hypothetical protein
MFLGYGGVGASAMHAESSIALLSSALIGVILRVVTDDIVEPRVKGSHVRLVWVIRLIVELGVIRYRQEEVMHGSHVLELDGGAIYQGRLISSKRVEHWY